MNPACSFTTLAVHGDTVIHTRGQQQRRRKAKIHGTPSVLNMTILRGRRADVFETKASPKPRAQPAWGVPRMEIHSVP